MLFKKISVWLASLFLVGLGACKNNYNDPSAGQSAINVQEIKDYLINTGLASRVTTSNTGLYYIITDTTSTSSETAALGEEVECTYTLSYISNGAAVFVDSISASKPLYYPFGIGAVIPGLESGLSLLKAGQRATLVMPYSLGFGADPRTINGVNIPAYSPLLFTVRLINSRTQDQQISEYDSTNNLTSLPDTTVNDVRIFWKAKTLTGDRITAGDSVRLSYKGMTFRNSAPFTSIKDTTIRFFDANFITGLSTGFKYLRAGDTAVLVFPSTRGYGTQGLVNNVTYLVPPYAPLAYEVTVVSVKPD